MSSTPTGSAFWEAPPRSRATRRKLRFWATRARLLGDATARSRFSEAVLVGCPSSRWSSGSFFQAPDDPFRGATRGCLRDRDVSTPIYHASAMLAVRSPSPSVESGRARVSERVKPQNVSIVAERRPFLAHELEHSFQASFPIGNTVGRGGSPILPLAPQRIARDHRSRIGRHQYVDSANRQYICGDVRVRNLRHLGPIH